jgi:hypothetical protein
VKIVLVFNGDKLKFEPNTVYLVTHLKEDLPKAVQHVVVPFDADSSQIRDESDNFRESIVAILNDSLIRDAFIANFHNFYFHIFRNIYKWIINLEAQLERYPDAQIVLTDIVCGTYMPLYEAEGEINKPLFYKSYDFIPQIIHTYLTMQGISCSFIRRQSRLKRSIRIFFRRYILLTFKPFYYTIQALRSKISKQEHAKDKKILLLSRSIAHTHLLFPLMDISNEFTMLYSEGFFTRGINSRFFLERKGKGVFLDSYYSITIIWQRFIAIVSLLLRSSRSIKKNAELMGLKLPLRSLLQEMLISYYDAIIYSSAVKKYISNSGNIKAIVTAETFTQYPYVLKSSLSDNKKIKLVQVANGALDILPNVKFVFADRLAITSHSVFDDYQNLHPKEKNKMVYWGDTKKVAQSVMNKQNFQKVLFFSQPYEFESQNRILYFLHQYSSLTGIKVSVKLHPRDTQTRKTVVRLGFEIVETSSLFNEYIREYDLAITRTSSIFKDIILSGVPFISVLFSEVEKSTNIEFIRPEYFTRFPGIYAFNENDLKSLLETPGKLCADCNEFLEYYKIKTSSSIDAVYFTEYLNTFANQ